MIKETRYKQTGYLKKKPEHIINLQKDFLDFNERFSNRFMEIFEKEFNILSKMIEIQKIQEEKINLTNQTLLKLSIYMIIAIVGVLIITVGPSFLIFINNIWVSLSENWKIFFAGIICSILGYISRLIIEKRFSK